MRKYIVVLADEQGPAFYLQDSEAWGPDRENAWRGGPATAEAVAEQQRKFFAGRFRGGVRIIVEEIEEG